MRTTQDSNAAIGSRPAISATAFYQVIQHDGRWNIVRASNGHTFCVCRSQEEADRLAAELNHDCARDPKHHVEQNYSLKNVG